MKRVSPPKAPPPPTRCTTLTTSSSEREEGQELRNRQRMVRERHEREKDELERLKRQHTVKEDLRRSSKRPTEDLNPYYEYRRRAHAGSSRDDHSSRSSRDRQRMERERREREKEELERSNRQHTVKEDSGRNSKRPAEDRDPYYEDRKRAHA